MGIHSVNALYCTVALNSTKNVLKKSLLEQILAGLTLCIGVILNFMDQGEFTKLKYLFLKETVRT
jgi:hypothetical protein